VKRGGEVREGREEKEKRKRVEGGEVGEGGIEVEERARHRL
jgi:hypothetical protein